MVTVSERGRIRTGSERRMHAEVGWKEHEVENVIASDEW
jgi:hypothetical protein